MNIVILHHLTCLLRVICSFDTTSSSSSDYFKFFISNTQYGRFERAMTVNESKIVPHIVNDLKLKLLIDIMETSTVMAGDQISEDNNGDDRDYGTCFLSAI